MNDAAHMAHALALGRRGLGTTWPNPAVGCVIVKDGRVVGRGWTQPGGRPHAEPRALAQAGDHARGADVFVTLEPCSHHGQTPPCAEALIAAGVSRVVIAQGDPDHRVDGRGAEMLRAAGITVETGLMAARAQTDLSGYLRRQQTGRPEVTLKLATSFDGSIATASGESQWITGPAARLAVHAMRARHDAVLVGAGTARSDDPSLTVRDISTPRPPVRVILSRRLDLPLDSKLMQTVDHAPVWLCHGQDADADRVAGFAARGAKLLAVPGTGGGVQLGATLDALGAQGLTRIFCEGGGALAASLLAEGLVDRLVGFTAGLTIGAEGLPAIGALGLAKLAEAPRFRLVSSRPVGGDLMHIWEPSP